MSLDPTTPDVRRLLTRVPQLAQASFEARDAVAACLRARRTAPGEMVISIGAPGDSLYFVVEGEFEVTLSDHSLNLGPGDFFGEIGLPRLRRSLLEPVRRGTREGDLTDPSDHPAPETDRLWK